jgi:hypothetical protein
MAGMPVIFGGGGGACAANGAAYTGGGQFIGVRGSGFGATTGY